MAEENKDVKEESSPQLEAAMEASAAQEEQQQQTPETETATPKEVETQEQVEEQPQEEQRVPYDRFKDVVDEKNWYKQQMEKIMQNQQTQQQYQQPQAQDPYVGMTPEERVFWQKVDERAAQKAQAEISKMKPILDAGRMELAQMKVQQFRSAHPDVKPNSPEELAIAELIQTGYQPDHAYWAIQGPKQMGISVAKAKQQAKVTMEAKKKANVESTSGIPTQSTSPTEPPKKVDIEKTFDKYWNLAEQGKL